jgi:hypothetical protein
MRRSDIFPLIEPCCAPPAASHPATARRRTTLVLATPDFGIVLLTPANFNLHRVSRYHWLMTGRRWGSRTSPAVGSCPVCGLPVRARRGRWRVHAQGHKQPATVIDFQPKRCSNSWTGYFSGSFPPADEGCGTPATIGTAASVDFNGRFRLRSMSATGRKQAFAVTDQAD